MLTNVGIKETLHGMHKQARDTARFATTTCIARLVTLLFKRFDEEKHGSYWCGGSKMIETKLSDARAAQSAKS